MNYRRELGSPYRLLIVDDNVGVTDSLRTLLEMSGLTVGVASSGAAAMASFALEPAHIVLVDLGMPQMNGFEFAKQLTMFSTPPLLLIAMTGWARPGDAEAVRAAGFDHYLTKPIDTDALESFIWRRLALQERAGGGLDCRGGTSFTRIHRS
jgi:CheY-like chemotaxis protein